MASSVQFLERWRCLSDPKTTDNERAGNYTVLTSYLKEGGLNPSFSKELCRHQQPLLHRILRDVTCKSCDHAALQVLGYCLHNVEFASKFNKEQVNSTIKGLQEVITNGNTEKSVCTRALWCLTNQQLPVDHMTSHVTSIITMAAEVVTVHQVGVATVSSEALNVLVRFGQQFLTPFAKLTPTWYKAVVELIICKVNKVQHKALSVAVSYEAQLQASHETTHWLTKILKERVVSVMLTQLTERGQDHVHVLKSWAHFVSVLGKTLHKHGSFLNELLRVVETGFKHRSPQVQVAAYDAWKTLITNFSLDLNVMTSSKRLKLLMMPLLASAVRERHDTVEQARIQTWWHLIGRLGNRRASQFQQVCVPFLLLCLGLDPKSDMSQLPDSICDLQSHSNSTSSDSKSLTDSSNTLTPKSNSTITLAVTPTPAASSGGAPPTSATPTSSHKHGRLLSTINTPRSRGGVEIEKTKKSSDRYQTPPTVAMVVTGCHALLEFTGSRDEFPHSLIKSDPGVCVIFPKLIVPMETAHFMLLFLDALLTYATQLDFKEKGISLDLVLHHIVTVLISSIEAEDGVSATVSASAALLVAPLVDLLHSGGLTEHLGRQMRMDALSQLSSLSPRLLLTAGGGRRTPSDCWRKLTSELLRASKPEQTSDWFSRNWLKLTKMIPSTSMPLSNMLFLSNELSRLVKEGGMEIEICSTLWTSLANELTSFITRQINSGTSVEPNFDPLRQILKFPFIHLHDNGERSHVTSVMDVWKSLYETANIHMGLVVKETNLCAELVCSDLYTAYGQYMKQVPSSLDQKHLVLRFDLYQNAVASALSYVMSKIKWGTLVAPATGGPSSKERGSGRIKSLETLLSLLAWQLAAFWDTAKKGPMQLSQLTTPYTLLDIVESLYHHVTNSALITMATEMIGQPLATLFEAILNSPPPHPSTGRSRMTQQDIENHVEKVWKSITICFQSRHAHPFDSALLSTLSPLLVATLNSSNRQLSNLTMSFWAVTFDKAQKLDYPARLRDYFVKYLKGLKQPTELKLPGLNGSALTLTSAQKELIDTEDSCTLGQSEVIQFSNMQSHSQSQNQDSDVLMVDVVLPNPSPQKKGVCGSFLNRPPMANSPLKPRPGPSSPLAKQLDEILARSATTMERVQSSPLKGVSVSDGKGAGSTLASARRRLDLGDDKEEYVSVGPPAVKKRRLLTEHQEEVMRERRTDLPTLYNALDPTLDSAPITMATLDQSTQQ